MDTDELSIGWQEYWINYKKQNNLQSRAEDYIIKKPINQAIIENKTLKTIYNTSNTIAPSTISIKKEKKIIHIKL